LGEGFQLCNEIVGKGERRARDLGATVFDFRKFVVLGKVGVRAKIESRL
jgi:hypothetical protein